MEFNYFYWVRSFGFGEVHFIVRLCHVTIALVFKLVPKHVIVSINHVIISQVYVLLVAVNVDIQGRTVV
jgi:hypothetical protein